MKTGVTATAVGQIPYREFQADMGAKKVTSGLLSPGAVITADSSAAGVKVGKDSICRIRVTATAYVAFGPSTIGAVDATTSPALELFTAGTYLVVATDDYIRSSAALTRLEVING